ncbi:uncharacterized protein LOC143247397 isoform X1 [Tachypleus tridentatus]|uniref:uncharacterized protein LOC143247397 isoform X1 n=1 Tax=Tachypleus tridentatus TaxID=6853 RepID=UPI003FD63015
MIGLQWTVPEDNYFEKPGCDVEVRYSEQMDDIIVNFEKAKIFNKTNVAVESLECKPPGEVQTIVFYLSLSEIPFKRSQTTLYFGVRVENQNHVKGEMSNWAYAMVDNTV